MECHEDSLSLFFEIVRSFSRNILKEENKTKSAGYKLSTKNFSSQTSHLWQNYKQVITNVYTYGNLK